LDQILDECHDKTNFDVPLNMAVEKPDIGISRPEATDCRAELVNHEDIAISWDRDVRSVPDFGNGVCSGVTLSDNLCEVAVDMEWMATIVIIHDVNLKDTDGVIEGRWNGAGTIARGVGGVVDRCGHGSVYRWHERYDIILPIDSS